MTYQQESVTLLTPAEMAGGIADHIFTFGDGGPAPKPSHFVLEDLGHCEVWIELATRFGLSVDLLKERQEVLLSSDGRRQLVQQLLGESGDYHSVWLYCQELAEIQ